MKEITGRNTSGPAVEDSHDNTIELASTLTGLTGDTNRRLAGQVSLNSPSFNPLPLTCVIPVLKVRPLELSVTTGPWHWPHMSWRSLRDWFCSSSMDHLQFAYQAEVGVDNAIIYLLHRAGSQLEELASTVRVMYLITVYDRLLQCIWHYPIPYQPSLLAEKLYAMQVDHSVVAWITEYLSSRPQYVRLQSTLSDVVADTVAPKGMVVIFTIYTSDFRYNTRKCHLQKFPDD